jgi:hypothetical protein
MQQEELATIALSMSGTIEGAHFGKRDFRCGKIFMSLPATGRAHLYFTPDQQLMFIALYPTCFVPLAKSWGAKGWTALDLTACDEETARHAVETAWKNAAPSPADRKAVGGIKSKQP